MLVVLLERTENIFPKTFFKSTLHQIEEIIFCYHDHLTAVKRNDRREVCALSTVLTNELTTVLIRGSESGTRREVSAPEIKADYNQFMDKVDLADQFICYYSVGRSGGEK